MDNIDIVFIINSFNRRVLLGECLNVLENWIPQSVFKNRCAAVIYEAGSTDGSIDVAREAVEKLSFQIEIILPQLDEDTSFAAGLNRGVAYAENKFPKLAYLVFYETDNQILTQNPLAQALSQLTSKVTLAACGFTVRQHNGNLAGVGEPFPTLLNFALGKNIVHHLQLEAIPYRWQQEATGVEFSEVDVVYTSPLLVKLEAWRASGGLDSERFPFSDCDVDWARRLRNLGWRMGVIRSEAVIHDNQAAISTWSKSRAIQYSRGRLRYFQRHRPLSIFAIWPGLLLLRHLVELAAVKLLVKEPARRVQLSKQFLELLKACPRKYEQA
jgi:GT2 family glycosyltransferase